MHTTLRYIPKEIPLYDPQRLVAAIAHALTRIRTDIFPFIAGLANIPIAIAV
jgi:hypothetical protein